MKREWDGRSVYIIKQCLRYPVEIDLAPETAGQLANLLRKQTGLANVFTPLPDGLLELLNALDYVLVGDPASVAAHRRMEAGKGMEPSGG